MIKLAQFYADGNMRDSVKEFLISHLKKKIVDTALRGDSTDGFKEANEVISSAFRDLEKTYGKKEAKRITSNR